ncbi:Anti-sigma regulatory factor (Ser/Thr protein kinase) [Streptomyces sp. yr375]|uniref:ATP-binding protein n=1 Tax=Streptomyces sp. yr375 TaxID=1761906 RepID=UPI0008D288D5|nr:ATP-binding protein [Streptomyces sp. yr375]SER03738.1 Anti-sigma regulatory factor (Ser/Thr protein kinase) [Streptomyces sp. yr375]
MPARAVPVQLAPPAPVQSKAHTFPRHRRSVGRAREELRKQLALWGVNGELADCAALLLSELTTNAIKARTTNGRRIGVRFELGVAGLRLEVSDSGDGKPELGYAGVDDESGRGLTLVDALAVDWGVSPRDGIGKIVWALGAAGRDGVVTAARMASTRVDLGFRLRVVAYVPGGFRTVLGEYEANSARLVMRCLRGRVGPVVGRLDGPTARQVHAWLRDADELQWALDGLDEGRPYVFQVITGTGLSYVFTAEPVDSAAVPLGARVGPATPRTGAPPPRSPATRNAPPVSMACRDCPRR